MDDAAKEKAFFLDQVAKGTANCSVISKQEATEYLGTMLGGFNVQCLIDALDDPDLAPIAQKALSHTLLVFDAFHDVEEKAKNGNEFAKAIMESWAEAEWFHAKLRGNKFQRLFIGYGLTLIGCATGDGLYSLVFRRVFCLSSIWSPKIVGQIDCSFQLHSIGRSKRRPPEQTENAPPVLSGRVFCLQLFRLVYGLA